MMDELAMLLHALEMKKLSEPWLKKDTLGPMNVGQGYREPHEQMTSPFFHSKDVIYTNHASGYTTINADYILEP